MEERRPYCSDVSLDNCEPLAGTASRVDHWILIEYRGLWQADAVVGSGLSDQVKEHLRARAAARPNTKLLFIRRTSRRGWPGLAVIWGDSPERGGRCWWAAIERYEELLELDFIATGEPVVHPLLLVCTHGKHDRCCARKGRPLYEALAELAEPNWVWQSSHIGGDRFAGNVVFLPEGLYFGRIDPGQAWALLDEYLAGRILLEHYRGRSAYTFPEQAAERAVREVAQLPGIDDLELVVHEGAHVTFRAGNRVFDVGLRPAHGELTYMTCTATTLSRARHFAAGILRESAA